MEKNMVFTASNETVNSMQRSANSVITTANKVLNAAKSSNKSINVKRKAADVPNASRFFVMLYDYC